MSFNSFDNPQLKYKKRSGIYSNSTGTNTLDPVEIKAVSYNWWCYLKVINGLVVFNDYNYSPSTSSHQSICKTRLKELNIKIDLFVNQRQCLDRGIDIETLFRSAVTLQIQGERKGRSLINAMFDLNESQYKLNELSLLEKKIKKRLSLKERSSIEKSMREAESMRVNKQREENRKKREEMKPKLEAIVPEVESLESITLFETLTDTSEVSYV